MDDRRGRRTRGVRDARKGRGEEGGARARERTLELVLDRLLLVFVSIDDGVARRAAGVARRARPVGPGRLIRARRRKVWLCGLRGLGVNVGRGEALAGRGRVSGGTAAARVRDVRGRRREVGALERRRRVVRPDGAAAQVVGRVGAERRRGKRRARAALAAAVAPPCVALAAAVNAARVVVGRAAGREVGALERRCRVVGADDAALEVLCPAVAERARCEGRHGSGGGGGDGRRVVVRGRGGRGRGERLGGRMVVVGGGELGVGRRCAEDGGEEVAGGGVGQWSVSTAEAGRPRGDRDGRHG